MKSMRWRDYFKKFKAGWFEEIATMITCPVSEPTSDALPRTRVALLAFDSFSLLSCLKHHLEFD